MVALLTREENQWQALNFRLVGPARIILTFSRVSALLKVGQGEYTNIRPQGGVPEMPTQSRMIRVRHNLWNS